MNDFQLCTLISAPDWAATPPYVAVIVSEPTGNTVVVTVTVPLEDVIVPLPSVTPPLVMVMVPVGPTGTEAVIVTDWPKVLEPEVLTVIDVVALLTTWTSTPELSLFNWAVILCDPTDRVDVVNVAVVPAMAPLPK